MKKVLSSLKHLYIAQRRPITTIKKKIIPSATTVQNPACYSVPSILFTARKIFANKLKISCIYFSI